MISIKEKKTKLILCFTPIKVKIITSKVQILFKRCRQTWLSSIANQSIKYVSVCDLFVTHA